MIWQAWRQLFLLIIFSTLIPFRIYADDITMTTYYSTPEASYKTLTVIGRTSLATAGGSVGIGTSIPNPSAILDIYSSNTTAATSKGILLPRLVASDIAAIPSPDNGLLVYNKDSKIFGFYDATSTPPSWKAFGGGGGGSVTDPSWTGSSNVVYNFTGNVGIGTPPADVPVAKLTIQDGGLAAVGSVGGFAEPSPFLSYDAMMLWSPNKAMFRAGNMRYQASGFVSLGSFVVGGGVAYSPYNYSVHLGNGNSAGGGIGLGYAAINNNSTESIAIGGGGGATPDVASNLANSYVIGTHTGGAGAANTVAIAHGRSAGGFYNNISGSVWLGDADAFNILNIPSLYIGGTNVGICNKYPQEKLHIKNGSVKANGLTCTSDARLKTNIAPLAHVLNRIDRIRGVRFQWNRRAFKEEGLKENSPDIGVIAQDLEKAFPELVYRSGKYKTVDYAKLCAVLLQGLKELESQNSSLERDLNSLEKQMRKETDRP